MSETAFGSADAERTVAEWREGREASAERVSSSQTSGGVDIVTGVALIALSVLLPILSYEVSVASGGGAYFVALGPLIYGVIRLTRGLSASKPGASSRPNRPYR